MVWARGMGTGTMEATPLVYDGVMYLPGPGDVIQAIDAKTGDLIWEYRRKLPRGRERRHQPQHRHLGHDAHRRQRRQPDLRRRRAHRQPGVGNGGDGCEEARARRASGPIIANGKVITGRQCQPDAGNDACIVTAHDAKTGKEVWRTRTIPLPGEPGYETWGDVPMAERWHVGTWMVPSYDPETNLIFVGTSVTIPAPKFIARPATTRPTCTTTPRWP